jgi:23S rRNA maturation mini-RNase III
VLPKTLKKESHNMKKKRKERYRSSAGMEGLISYLKHDHRMLKDYLKGTAGDETNTLLAAGYNMMK